MIKTFYNFLIEKKDHIIKKIPALSQDEKDYIIKIFKEKPHLEDLKDDNGKPFIDWGKWRKLTYDDFGVVLNYTSKTERKKKVKSGGIKGLKKNKDYIEVKTGSKYYDSYIPLNYEASKLIASKYVGHCEGEWCTAFQKTREYWDDYTKQGVVFVYVIHRNEEEKYAVAIYPNNKSKEIFDRYDDSVDDIPDYPLNKLFTSSISKLYDVVRRKTLIVGTFLEKAKFSDDADFKIEHGYVTWYSGTWYSGDWHVGRWINGDFQRGNFRGGAWLNGTFSGDSFSGEWHGGTFEGKEFTGNKTIWMHGIFKKGIFNAAEWNNGEWHGGTWKSGNWNKGYDDKGTLYKIPPPIWNEQDFHQELLKYFQFPKSQHKFMGQIILEFKDDLIKLMDLAKRGEIQNGTKAQQIFIQIDGKGAISLMDCDYDSKLESVFKDTTLYVTNSDVKYIKDSSIILRGCKIFDCDIDMENGVYADCDFVGGNINVDNLADGYGTNLTAFGVKIWGCHVSSKEKHKMVQQKTWKDCELVNLAPRGAFTRCHFHKCLIDVKDVTYTLDCTYTDCEFIGDIDSTDIKKQG